MEGKQDKQKLSIFLATWLKNQVGIWADKGILNEGQKNDISSLYIWPEEKDVIRPPEKPSLKLITVLQAIGAFFIGIGVISFVAFNWTKMPNLAKLILIIIAIASSHFAGLYLLGNKPKYQKAGLSFIFLGNILYGAGIWLVAQMYHISYGFTTGLFLWALGIIPFVYLAKSKLNYFLSIGLFLLWTLRESIGFQKPHLSYLFILLGLLGPLSYYLKSKVGLTLCILTGGIWLLVNNIFWFEESISIYLFLPLTLYGIALLSLSNLHSATDKLKGYRRIYGIIGTVIYAIYILLLPLIGMINLGPRALTSAGLSPSFWVCSFLLLLGSIFINMAGKEIYLDRKGVILKIFPYLLASAFYVFVVPYIRPSLIPMLLPVALVAFSYWYFSRSRLLLNLSWVYFFLWLPFCLIEWKQPFDLFLLYLFYGLACYMLGWAYISKFQDRIAGVCFKFFGLLVTFFSLYIFAFRQISEGFAKGYRPPTSFDFWMLIFSLYAGALFLHRYVVDFTYPTHKKGLLPEERIIMSVLFAAPVVIFVVFSYQLTNSGYTFLINL
ncbi:MAG: DUF2157 domain-containing protein, partial [Candidatus Omnitrophota bacterium]